MIFCFRPSSAFASTSGCQNAPVLPPRPATASRISQALFTLSKTSSQTKSQRASSWEIINASDPPISAAPPPPTTHSASPQEDCASWEVIDDETSVSASDSTSRGVDEVSNPQAALAPEPTSPSEFDTEAFPPHSHLFPSSPNGTWRNESFHALTHPTAVDYAALCTKLRVLVEEASDEVSTRVNRAFEGSDVPAMHDRVLGLLPSLSIPDMRDFERAVDAGYDWGVGVLERRRTRSRRRRW